MQRSPVGIQNFPYIFYENSKWMPLEENSELVQLEPEQHRSYWDQSGIGDSNWDPMQVGPILASKAVAYIEKHTADNPNQPFFMQYNSQAVHLPHTPPAELDGVAIAGSTPGTHGDMVHELDTQVGMIIKCLKETGIYENTLMIFTSDNGGLYTVNQALADAGHDSTNGLRGSKGNIYEGGDRVPFVAVWPKMIQASAQSQEPVVGHDIVATMAAITGQTISKDIVMDSLNLLPMLFGEEISGGHDVILHQSPNALPPQPEIRPQSPDILEQLGKMAHYAIRRDGWKLIILAPDKNKKSVKYAKPIALFNLSNNPLEDEDYNLIESEEYQSLINELFDKYIEIREKDNATVNNYSFDFLSLYFLEL
ncbi:MAG: sulfatase-like hydrolase/transferase [Anaerolineae bacterium]|jgi:arylsulfatase A-like enzyme|nr:sulfatase-like hydrolase/transferase [Anaerolineae bacterium]MBT7600637.1 sulfatase-like hydrolase/transferase [Anaerolineae bacterium]MBT7781673.1 sulfatase-like hydrolase/transferase [Anaerolineae bacterium]